MENKKPNNLQINIIEIVNGSGCLLRKDAYIAYEDCDTKEEKSTIVPFEVLEVINASTIELLQEIKDREPKEDCDIEWGLSIEVPQGSDEFSIELLQEIKDREPKEDCDIEWGLSIEVLQGLDELPIEVLQAIKDAIDNDEDYYISRINIEEIGSLKLEEVGV